MMISDKQIQQVTRLYGQQKRLHPVEKASPGTKAMDGVNLSREAQEIQVIRQQIKDAPDLRTDRILALQKSIRQGTYNVSGQEIAAKMLGRFIVDQRIK